MIGIERRVRVSRWDGVVAFGLALAIAVVTGAIIFLALGVNPLRAYAVMIQGAVGSGYAFSETVVKAIPLTFTGLAVALAATMLLWNIGCEGQLVWGGIAAAGVGLFWAEGLPGPLAALLMILAGAAGGAVWALIPAVLKARFRVSEILTTLLLNYVAIIYMEHLYYGPWRNPQGYGFPGTAMLPDVAQLPRFFGTRVHLGLFLALAAAVLLRYALGRTGWGYRVRVIGQGASAAKYAGMSINKQMLLVMALSGALAGLAGMAEVGAIHYRLQQGLAVGYGYDGIIVAWLARLNPLLVPLAALLLGGLIIGGEQLQSVLRLPASISMVLEAALLFGLIASEALQRWRIVFKPREFRPAPVIPDAAGEE